MFTIRLPFSDGSVFSFPIGGKCHTNPEKTDESNAERAKAGTTQRRSMWKRNILIATPSMVGATVGIALGGFLFDGWIPIFWGALLGVVVPPMVALWWIAERKEPHSDTEALVKHLSNRMVDEMLNGQFNGTTLRGFEPDLRAGLAHPVASVRRGAAAILSEIDELTRQAIPPLLDALSDPDQTVRQNAMEALAKIGDPAVAPAAMNMLDDPAWPVRVSATQALGQIGRPSKVVTARLADTVKADDSQWVRMGAVRTLVKICEPDTMIRVGNADYQRQDLASGLVAFEAFLRECARHIATHRRKGEDFDAEALSRKLMADAIQKLTRKQRQILDLLHGINV